jgi:xylulokinase
MPVVEGGALSPLWRQIISDICGIDTVFMEGAQGAPFGDALIAGVALGVFPSYRVAKDWLEYSDCTMADPERHALYSEMFDMYLSLYESQKENFERLSSFAASRQ